MLGSMGGIDAMPRSATIPRPSGVSTGKARRVEWRTQTTRMHGAAVASDR